MGENMNLDNTENRRSITRRNSFSGRASPPQVVLVDLPIAPSPLRRNHSDSDVSQLTPPTPQIPLLPNRWGEGRQGDVVRGSSSETTILHNHSSPDLSGDETSTEEDKSPSLPPLHPFARSPSPNLSSSESESREQSGEPLLPTMSSSDEEGAIIRFRPRKPSLEQRLTRLEKSIAGLEEGFTSFKQGLKNLNSDIGNLKTE